MYHSNIIQMSGNLYFLQGLHLRLEFTDVIQFPLCPEANTSSKPSATDPSAVSCRHTVVHHVLLQCVYPTVVNRF